MLLLKNVVLRELRVFPGEIFSRKKLMDSYRDIFMLNFFENVITITQNGEREWANLDQDIQSICDKFVQNHDIFFEESLEKNNPFKHLNE